MSERVYKFTSAQYDISNPRVSSIVKPRFPSHRRDPHVAGPGLLPQAGQHPATPRRILWAVLRPVAHIYQPTNKFRLTPQTPPLPQATPSLL
jgi:hypothetical protein